MTASYRMSRIVVFRSGADTDAALPVPPGAVLARGRRPVRPGPRPGRREVGLPANAQNDFIFAIIGEELGFVGACAVLPCSRTLAYTGLRIAAPQIASDSGSSLGTPTMCLVGQAAINIGYVVGLLPVTGFRCR